MRPIYFSISILLFIHLLFLGRKAETARSIPNFKKAYSEHYQGSLLYSEGFIQKANNKFKNAYSILPDNFYFCLAYGLSEGRLGREKNGLELINQAFKGLEKEDPDYLYKKVVARFLKGMVYAYNESYANAYTSVRSALYQAPDSAYLKSTFENTLGYLTILNQSKNRHKGTDLGAHIHVRKGDLEKALSHFSNALEWNEENFHAYENYKTLCDTLQLVPQYNPPGDVQNANANYEPTFLNMHQKIMRGLDLETFESVAFLVDVSGSMVMEKVLCMGQTRFEVMKILSRKIVNDLPSTTDLGIGTIGGDCLDTPAKWKPTGSLDKRALDQDLRFLIPDGTTPMLSMLLKVAELFPDSVQQKKSVFLISDGANTCREGGFDVCSFALDLSRKGIVVNVLTFLNSTYNNTGAFSEYICLADNTGGKVIYMDNLRCHFEPFNFDLVSTCNLSIPKLEKSQCWGPAIKTLWMYQGAD